MAQPIADEQFGCVRVGDKLFTGLNIALNCSFYPRYTYKAATQGPLQQPVATVVHDKLPKNPLARGKLIDRTVNKMCQLCTRGASLDVLISDEAPPAGPLAAEIRGFRRMCVDYVSAQLIPYLIEHKLTPVETQVPVADTCVRVGTFLDLVCRTATGGWVVFENKIGFNAYYHRHTGHAMAAPFEFLEDSPHAQHQMYLAFAVSMFERNRQVTVDRAECAVLRMTEGGLCVHPLVNWPHRRTLMARAWCILAHQKEWNHKDHVNHLKKHRLKANSGSEACPKRRRTS